MTNTIISPQWTGFITNLVKKHKKIAAVAPMIVSPKRFPHGPFQFQVKLTAGCDYEIQASTDMKNWTALVSDKSQSDTVEQLDSNAAKFSFRFYRAICSGLISNSIMGYASVALPPGFSMIANPFNASSNTIASLFSEMPEGTTFCKFDTSLFRLTNNSVKGGKWTNINEKLAPGEGGIFFNPTTDFKTVNFVGEVSQGRLLNPIPAGMSIRSSLVPQPGRLNSDLAFPVSTGDVVHLFDRDQQKYVLYPYSPEAWEKNPPIVGVGESFWVSKTQPGNWVRNFAVS